MVVVPVAAGVAEDAGFAPKRPPVVCPNNEAVEMKISKLRNRFHKFLQNT